MHAQETTCDRANRISERGVDSESLMSFLSDWETDMGDVHMCRHWTTAFVLGLGLTG